MEARAGQRTSMDVALCGSGLLWAWGYLVHFAGPDGFAEMSHPLWMNFSDGAFLVASLVSYLAVVAVFERLGEDVALRVSRIGCAAMTVGAVALVLSTLMEREVMWIALPSSVAAGAGMALCQVAWGVPLSKADMDTLEKTVLSWFPLSGVVFLAIAASAFGFEASNTILMVLLVLLPTCAHMGLERSLKRWGGTSGELSPRDAASFDEAATKRRLPPMLACLLCVFVFLSFVWLAFTSRGSLSFGLSMMAFFVGALVLLVLTWVSLRQTRRFSLTTLYRWALPLAVLAIAFASVGGPILLFVSYVLLVAVYIGFDAIAKLYFVYGAQRYAGHATLVFGLGSLMICLGGVGGTFLWRVAEGRMAGFDFATTMLVALVPFVCAIAFTMGHEPLVEKRRLGEVMAAFEGAPSLPGGAPAQSVPQQCAALARRHGLTPREQEIVTLLAQGRSRSYIRETLYISKGTVDTHAYHAYAKLGIKTRDELMRLIDELAAEE